MEVTSLLAFGFYLSLAILLLDSPNGILNISLLLGKCPLLGIALSVSEIGGVLGDDLFDHFDVFL